MLAMTGDSTATWTSPMFEKLYSNDSSVNPFDKPITDYEYGWIGSLLNIGAMIGPFIYGYISEKFGRRITLLSIAVPHLIAYLTLAFAHQVWLYYVARLIAGFAVGGGYTLMPMYIAEISEPRDRGKMSVTLNIFWTLGNFLPYAFGTRLSAMWFNVVLACLPAIFFVIFFFCAPETPYYLVAADKIDQAKKSLMVLRSKDGDGVEDELEQIKQSVHNEEHGDPMDLLRIPVLRKALSISLLLIFFQQMSGINAVLYYLLPIFVASGSTISSDMASMYFGLVLFGSSFTTPFLADRIGRRLLLIISCVGVIIALALMGAFFYMLEETNIDTAPLFWVPLFGLILFIFCFNLGLSPVVWTISSELFPTGVKAAAASATTCVCCLTSFIVTKFFNDMNSGMGGGPTFWFFGGFTLAAMVFIILFVPETKGKTFDEIQDMLYNKKS